MVDTNVNDETNNMLPENEQTENNKDEKEQKYLE